MVVLLNILIPFLFIYLILRWFKKFNSSKDLPSGDCSEDLFDSSTLDSSTTKLPKGNILRTCASCKFYYRYLKYCDLAELETDPDRIICDYHTPKDTPKGDIDSHSTNNLENSYY